MNTSCQCESSREACEASIPDVQGRGDHRQIAIDQVGVKDVRYPISVRTRDGGHETDRCQAPKSCAKTFFTKVVLAMRDLANPSRPCVDDEPRQTI